MRQPALSLEALDVRSVPATFTVTTGADIGPGSLRQAILDSNATAGVDTVAFNIDGGGVQTIQPTAALPTVTDPVVIDGTTQPGFTGTPIVVLTGTGFNGGANGYGLLITAGNSTVRGLVVNGFAGADIRIEGGGSNLVAGNYLGTNAAGTAAVPGPAATANVGLLVRSGDNTIGGATAADRNLIAGHNDYGVHITGAAAAGNRLLGNFVGTDVTGAVALANYAGVVVNGASNNRIGGPATGEGNLVSGNTITGIGLIAGTGNWVQGNRVGTDVTGTLALGNRTGVYVQGGVGHQIGGAETGAGNLISGSFGSGPSFGFGVIITENQGVKARDHQVLGNYIGTNAAGTAAIPNNADGIRVDFNSTNVAIGGTAPGTRNLVSGNGDVGIVVTSGTGNVVQGNYVGTNAAGTAAIPNESGIAIGGSGNTIGGTAPGAGNLVSGNGTGVGVSGTSNVVQGNRIGTNAAGTAAVPNTFDGIVLSFGSGAVIGGTASGAGNLISGNLRSGIYMASASNSRVQGNYIGTDATGTLPLGNGDAGVHVSGAGHVVGGPAAGARNVISANRVGVEVTGNGTTVQGNFIGTDATGTAPLGNGVGVFLTFSDKVVGGAAAGEGNTIAYNTGAGVVMDAVEGGTGLRVRGNAIYSNGGLGIDLAADGVTTNDPGDTDAGPNGRQNFPVLGEVWAGRSTRVTGTLNSAPQKAYTLDFYAGPAADPSGYGEGARYLGSGVATTDAAGNVQFEFSLAQPTALGEVVTATATDPAGNTSEFTLAVFPIAVAVDLDILPGDPTNTFDLNSGGVLAVAVPTTPEFDAATIDASDLSQIRFGDVDGTVRVSPEDETLGDVDGDGDLDRVFTFSISSLRESGALTPASTRAGLGGNTFQGPAWWGEDAVTVTLVNQAPAVTTNTGLAVAQGATVVVAPTALRATDPNGDAVAFAVTAGPTRGTLRLAGVPTTTFTQADIDAGRVTYAHDGTRTASDGFTVTVSDGALTSGPVTVGIAVELTPIAAADVDVLPGGANAFDLNAAGLLPVAVLSTPALDTTTINATDLSKVRFGDAGTAARVSPVSETVADVDGDGDQDRVFVFSVRAIRESGALTGASTQAELSGTTFQGVPWFGTDAVTVLLVNQVPAVTANPGLTVNQGETATIPLTASDPNGDPVTYTVTAGPTHGTLRVNGVPATTFTQANIDAGRVIYVHDGTRTTTDGFTVTVTDGALTSALVAVAVAINTDPLVTLQPVSQSAFAGTVVTFTAAADGSPAPTVRWQVSTNGGQNFTDIPGATSPTLSFKATAALNGARYRAVFTNPAGTATTTAATLLVTSGLAVQADPVAQTAPVGGTATFTAAATGSPKPKVQWQVSLDGGATFSDIRGAVGGTYRVKAVATVDGNLYRAVFTSAAGTAATTAAGLTVDYRVTVAGSKKALAVPAGTAVSLTGMVTGLTAPTVQWEASTDQGKTYTPVAGETAPTLTFTAAAGDDGTYLRAVFTAGTRVRRTAPVVLAVGDPPAVVSAPADLFVGAGATATFSVTASGSPPVKVQWQVSTDGGRTFTDIGGATKPALAVKKVTLGLTDNLYRAVLTNAFDQVVTRSAELTVT
jgi:parallel beta-helix repeat protein